LSTESCLAGHVTLDVVGEVDRALIDGLSQFYIYDFSEMDPVDSTVFSFTDQGQFSPLPDIDDYWGTDGSHALAIRFEGRIAGFVLINTRSHRNGGTVERNMGEFFVARQYRRVGVATEAVRQVLERFPGRWEVAVVERNGAAKAFWPRAIAAAPTVSGLIRVEGNGDLWCGPIWCFTVRPST
jgi:predicted acetyltransferase